MSFETDPPSVSEVKARIESTVPRHPWLVAIEEGRTIGFAYAGPHRARAAYRWAVDVSAYVEPARQRTGVGRALYTALPAIVEAQGHRSAHAGIALPNPASVTFHETFGFEPVGVYKGVGWKLGKWQDVGWWQLLFDGTGDTTIPSSPVGVDRLEPKLLRALLDRF